MVCTVRSSLRVPHSLQCFRRCPQAGSQRSSAAFVRYPSCPAMTEKSSKGVPRSPTSPRCQISGSSCLESTSSPQPSVGSSTGPERTTKPSTGYCFSMKSCLSWLPSHISLFFVLSDSEYCEVQVLARWLKFQGSFRTWRLRFPNRHGHRFRLILSGLVINSRLLHVLQHEHAASIAPSPE